MDRGTQPRPYADLRDVLESPTRSCVIGVVPSVGVVVIEDRRERFRGFASEPIGADVDGSVGEVGEDSEALLTKGSSTCSWYKPSATSASSIAMSSCSAM